MAPAPPDPLTVEDGRLLRDLDAACAAVAQRAGPWLVCRPGCTECCIGPFPINALDAHRLRRGLEDLRRTDPARAEALLDRARAARDQLAAGFPGEPGAGRLSEDDELVEAFLARHATLPCPVLDPATGHCELYAHRPLACRTYGPPVRLGHETLPPCRLCFQGASAAVLEACHLAPDPESREDTLLDQLEARSGVEGETLIAFALR